MAPEGRRRRALVRRVRGPAPDDVEPRPAPVGSRPTRRRLTGVVRSDRVCGWFTGHLQTGAYPGHGRGGMLWSDMAVDLHPATASPSSPAAAYDSTGTVRIGRNPDNDIVLPDLW